LQRATIKLLILGAGGSGKTTLRKQFTRLYANGFQDVASRKELRELIVYNMLEGAQAVLKAAQDADIGGGLRSPDAERAASFLERLHPDARTLDEETVKSLKILAKDEGVQRAMDLRSKYQVQECFFPYLKSCIALYPEWGGASWIPSADDCVRSRTRSSGIIEVEFEYEKVRFKLFDAGGQRAERRKWLHAFDDVTALIFVSSLTEYDEVLFEDKSKNRLKESLEVWEELVNSSHFTNTPTLLFLNKLDLFEDKYLVRKVPLNDAGLFPDAPQGEPDKDQAIAWISSLFQERHRKADPSLLYIHLTTAVDSTQVNQVFNDVKEIVLFRTCVGGCICGPGRGALTGLLVQDGPTRDDVRARVGFTVFGGATSPPSTKLALGQTLHAEPEHQRARARLRFANHVGNAVGSH
jgi:GTPase SAR1 family protein